jgi:hypothetical protein
MSFIGQFFSYLAMYAQIWTVGSLVYAGGARNTAFAAATLIMFYGLNTSSALNGLGYYALYATATLYFMRYFTTSASIPIRYLEGSFVPAMITLASRALMPN